MNLTIVLVIYNCKLENSLTFQTLLQNIDLFEVHNTNFQLIIYDNSLIKQDITQLSEKLSFQYVHDESNLGIAAPYNYALKKGQENGSDWLLLLDQDTSITNDYLNEILLVSNGEIEEMAIVPQIVSQEKLVSPVLSNGFQWTNIDNEDVSLPKYKGYTITCINSGAMIRISFLNSIGGFNETEFPLDGLDHWLFYRMHLEGGKICIIDAKLIHDLSVSNYNNISLKRHISILESEMLLVSKYRPENLKKYKRRLVLRFFKHLLLVRNKKIAYITLKQRLKM